MFSDETIKKAWDACKGRCEICGKKLVWDNRGDNTGKGAWEAHHKNPILKGGSDSIRNCQILCVDCHKNTDSYGKH